MTPSRGPDGPERLETDRLASRADEEDAQVGRAAAGSRTGRGGEAQGWLAAFGAARFVLAAVVVAAAVVGAVVLLSAGKWWALAIVVVVLLGGLGLGVALALRATTQVEKPSAETVARLDEEGVSDPEGAINERVDAAPEDEQGEADAEAALDRRAVEQPAGERAEEQKGKVTPSSSASRPVGPGSGDSD